MPSSPSLMFHMPALPEIIASEHREVPQWTTLEELALAEAWVDAQLGAAGLSPLGQPQIVKCGSISVVWRQPTATGREVFFKLVPPLFAQEPPLTEWLSQRWPANVPSVLATDRRHRWMLTGAVEGAALSELHSLQPWVSAIRTLARIQIDSVGHAAKLVECGCPTRNLASLTDELDLQLSETIPLPAVHGRRRELFADVALLAASGVPSTLVHGDFSADNIMISSHNASPVIIDWTDGSRSHPFFDLLIFLTGRAATPLAAQREALVHAYLSEWTEAGAGSIGTLREVFAVAQRLAPLYHAGSYRRILSVGAAAAIEFAPALQWLLGLLIDAS